MPETKGATRDLDGTSEERENAPHNYLVGTQLMFENDDVRVWENILDPGTRCLFHRHRCNYMWIIHQPARLRVRTLDGTEELYDHYKGEVTFIPVQDKETVIHDVANVDDRIFRATVVEFKNNDEAFWRPVDLIT